MDYALEKEQSKSQSEYINRPTDDGYQIVLYEVSGNNIILKELPSLPSALLDWQQDTKKHQEIWEVFVKIIPESSRNVNIFYLTTDGEGGIERDLNDPSTWRLFYDIIDAYSNEVFDDKEIVYTTIHEFGHIIISGPDQIELDPELINFYTDEEFEELFQIKTELCYPRTIVADRCAKSDSYINLFYQKFWTDIISDWDEIQYIEDDDEFFEQSDLFYEKYQDRFVSVYASTNIDEDIAESWTAFVLKDKPAGETMTEQKILFFYDFPELVDICEHIRKELI